MTLNKEEHIKKRSYFSKKNFLSYLLLIPFLLVISGCYNLRYNSEFNTLQKITNNRINMDIERHDLVDQELEEKIMQALKNGIDRNTVLMYALMNNKNLQAAFESLGIAKSDWLQANLFTNPEFNGLYIFTRHRRRNMEFTKQVASDVLFYLNDIWQVPMKGRVAYKDLEITILKIMQEILDTMKNSRRVYDEIISSKVHIAYALQVQKLLGALRELYERLVKKKKDENKEPDIQSDIIDVSINKIQFEVIKQQASLKTNYAKLRKVLGLQNINSEKVKVLEKIINISLYVPSVQELLETAFKYRPEIQIALLNIRRAQHKLKLEQASVFKDVEFGGFFLTSETDNGREASGLILTEKFGGPQITVEVPLFNQNQAQISKAYYEYKKAQRTYIEKKIEIQAEIYELYERIMGLKRKILYYEKRIEPFVDHAIKYFSKVGEKDLNENLNIDDATSLVYIESTVTLYRLRHDYFESLSDFAESLTNIERATSKRLDLKFDRQTKVAELRELKY